MKNKKYYIEKRDKYFPDNLRLIFIAESPPASGKYFYAHRKENEDTKGGYKSEPLFTSMMKYVLNGYAPRSKLDGLLKFKDMGYFLIECVYTPINKLSDRQREEIILKNRGKIYKDLKSINKNKSVPIVLIKKNVCSLLECWLLRKGYNVLNDCQVVPFPASGNQTKFGNIIKELLAQI